VTEQTSDERLEALGRIVGFAIHAGEGLDERDYPIGEIPTDWKRAAEAILEDLGFVTPAGEVYCPDKGAVKVAAEALRRARACPPNRRFWEQMNAALAALTGEEQR